MTNGEIREALLSLACAITTQANRDVRPRVNSIESTVASRLIDFTRMNPPTLFGSKVDEDLQNFIDEVFRIVDAMGVTPREKAELASYQLKDIAQLWFERWRGERPIGADLIDWGVFKTTFLDRFFPWERNLVELMNLRQGNMSVKEYSLKFTQLSKYAPTLVANSRARMNKFVMGVFGSVEKECRTAMLHHDMNISRLMVYAQQLEETKLMKMDRDMKRARPGNGGGSTFERPWCATCGKQHLGKCLAGTDGCFECGSKGHKMRDFPTLKAKGKETNQVAHDDLDPNAPKRNHFYILQANNDKGTNEGKSIFFIV
ncbi:uncharacterized protein LOC125869781 [Solanum stenotomum]|uniref:uncharacterized protein LOC125869781 n=1 Tax=Solanum stenotomum TaxID=172797 RepID=UPI0020D0B718|nr:uncharacterized protein LOC125869781 [Solanum stenotomum]